MEAAAATYECLLFDMDDTLYPMSTGINTACRNNIQEYMVHELGIEASRVPEMCLDLYREYGTTMAGLKALGYELDDDEFHRIVHGRLPYDNLKPDPVLRNLLLSMPQRKIVFTNADRRHAEQVLCRLGLEGCFEGVICFETLNNNPALDHHPSSPKEDIGVDELGRPKSPILCKPSVQAMEAAVRIAGVDPKKTVFFDDSTRNIAAGKAVGFRTVIVGRAGLVAGADVALESIHNVREALPEIWEEGAAQVPSAVLAMETAVLA